MTVVDDTISLVKQKPWIVVAVGGAAVWFWYIRPAMAGGAGDQVEDDSLGLDGGPYDTSGRIPGPVIDTDTDHDDNGSSLGVFETNAQWEAAAIDFLVARGFTGAFAQTAITKALTGEVMTTAEKAAVSLALGALHNPPQGMPPLNAEPPPTTPPPATGSGYGQNVTGGKITMLNVLPGYKVNGWIRDVRRQYRPDFSYSTMVKLNPGIQNSIKWVAKPPKSTEPNYFIKARTVRIW